MAGVVPGVVLATLLGLTTWWIARKNDYPRMERTGWDERLRAFRESVWGLLLIVVVIGGIYTGIFTPTEAAAMSAVYAFIVAVFVYKDLTLAKVPKVLLDSASMSSMLLYIITNAVLFSKFYTWIVRIAVNQALMKLRKRRSDRAVSLDEQIDTGEDTVVREIAAWDPDPEQRYSQEELHTILSEVIDELAPIYRTVFTLRDVDGLSTEETADALDLSVPAVKSRLLRARLQLREKLTRFFKRKGDDAFAYM